MLKRVVLLPDGDPRDRLAFSGITHYFTAALRRVCQSLQVALSVVNSFPLVNTEDLLRTWAVSKEREAPPSGTGSKCKLHARDERIAAAEATEFALEIRQYYATKALEMQRFLAGRIRHGDLILSLNPFYPHVGRVEFPICYYLDCSVVSFYLDPLYGTVPAAARVAPIRDALIEIERLSISSAERIFTFSRAALDELVNMQATIAPRTEVVGAGINFSRFPDFRRHDPNGKVRLLFVGRDFERKGGRIVAEAARFLDMGHFHITCVTDAKTQTDVYRGSGVRFLNSVSKKALLSLLNRSQIFLAPTKREPYGLALAEAMAFSLPVLASNVSAVPEILGPGNPGLLGESPDPQDLACAVRQFGSDSALYEQTSLGNYLRAKLNFQWDRVAYSIVDSALRHRIWL